MQLFQLLDSCKLSVCMLWKPNTLPPQAFLHFVPDGIFSSLFSSVQYVLPLLCTGELDVANGIAFSMAVSTKLL